jgi:hypothetical protein
LQYLLASRRLRVAMRLCECELVFGITGARLLGVDGVDCHDSGL